MLWAREGEAFAAISISAPSHCFVFTPLRENFSDGLGNLFRLKHRRAQHKSEKFHSFAHIFRDISSDMLVKGLFEQGCACGDAQHVSELLQNSKARDHLSVGKLRTPTTEALQPSRAQQSSLFVFPDITQLTSTIIFIICVE